MWMYGDGAPKDHKELAKILKKLATKKKSRSGPTPREIKSPNKGKD